MSKQSRVGIVLLGAVVFGLSATAWAASVGVQADALGTPQGASVRFSFNQISGRIGAAPVVRRMTITKPTALRIAMPPVGVTIGRLAFSVGTTKPSNRRVITLRRVRRNSALVGSGAGATVALRPTASQFLRVSLPAGAINPVVSFTGPGARLFAFRCRATTFRGSTLLGSDAVLTNATSISTARLRRAGLC
jgi:hypothetical protein